MLMHLRAYKTELDPTAAQRRSLARHVAAARTAHNWSLERWHQLAGAKALTTFCHALSGWDPVGGRAACAIGAFVAALGSGRTKPKRGGGVLYVVPAGIPIPDRSPSGASIHAALTAEKNSDASPIAWIAECSPYAVREGSGDVEDAYKHFWRRLKQHAAGDHSECKPRKHRKGCNLGEPRFRSAVGPRSYHTDQPNPIRVTDRNGRERDERGAPDERKRDGESRAILIPKVGWVRLKEHGYLPVTHDDSHYFVDGGKACGLGISAKDGRWYVAMRAEVPNPTPQPRGPGRALREHPTPRIPGRRMGVENGVRVLAVGYDGDTSDVISDMGLRDDRRIQKLVMIRQRWERRMARRWKDGIPRRDQSKGWWEARARVAHYHARIVNLRDDRVGKIVRKIVDRGAETILLREPHVAELLNRQTAPDAAVRNRLAPDVHGARMGDLRERLEYKQKWAGGKVELVDKFEPVTKRCSMCAVVRASSPGYPDFVCSSCGHREDRDDANAPRNLYQNSTGSDPGEADPRSADLKPPQGGNGHEKRSTRSGAQALDTPLQGGEISALGSGNRDLPGAPHSVRSNDPHHWIAHEIETRSDDQNGSAQFREDTASTRADDRDRSQTATQPAETIKTSHGGSETIS